MHIYIVDEACEELTEAVSFYEEQVKGLGLDLEYEIRQSFSLILENPELVAKDKNGVRKFLVNRFPFIIHYTNDKDVIRIWAIAHAKRRPGYWKSRK